MKILPALLALFLALPSLAGTWSESDLQVGRYVEYIETSSGVNGSLSAAVSSRNCASLVLGFDAAGASAESIMACEVSTGDGSDCVVTKSLNGPTGAGETATHGRPWMRVRTDIKPAAGANSLSVYCSQGDGNEAIPNITLGNYNGVAPASCGRVGERHKDLDYGYMWTCVDAAEEEFVFDSVPDSGNTLLIVGDSWAVGHIKDEPWAQYGPFYLSSAGFTGRFHTAFGAAPGPIGMVHSGFAFTTGNLFGASPGFDIVQYVKEHPSVSDVLIILGHNDYVVTACSHGTPLVPTSPASGVCTVDQTIANLKYVFDQLLALPQIVGVHWQMPPGWLGQFQDDAAPGVATYQDAIQRTNDELVTHCSGKRCYPGAEMYMEACAGDNTAGIDPTAAGNCTNNNTVNYGDGGGLINRLNAPLVYYEDLLHKSRSGSAYRLHANGYGYHAMFRVLMQAMVADDATLGTRFPAFQLNWLARAGVPGVTIGTVTATSIQVTPTRGLHVNGSGGSDGKCGYGQCKYVCWATCVDSGTPDAADPACWDSTDAIATVPRDIGAPDGAAHYIEDVNWNEAPRDFVELHEGELGTLRGLSTGTDYKVVCVAVSPTSVSHPGIRNQTTP